MATAFAAPDKGGPTPKGAKPGKKRGGTLTDIAYILSDPSVGPGGDDGLSGDDGPSGDESYWAQVAAQNAAGRASSAQQNANTKALADQQYALLAAFGKSRDIKLGNIQQLLDESREALLRNYGIQLGILDDSSEDNDAAASDNTYQAVENAARERGEIVAQAAMQGSGETDMLRAQVQALRNFNDNQSATSRSYFDTLGSINASIQGLNVDASTGLGNIWNQAEADRESSWANYYNQMADTWTQIGNIENSNSNVDSDSSVGYQKAYGQAGTEAANYAGQSYSKQAAGTFSTEWDGKGEKLEGQLNTGNWDAMEDSTPKLVKAEGATLRSW